MAGKEIPVGVKIISVLYYILAAFMIIGLIGIILVGKTVLSTYKSFSGMGNLDILGGALIIVASIIFTALAILCFFIGLGLWKGQKWARIVAIIIAILGVLGAIMGMVQGQILNNIVSLVVQAIIGGYLLFGKSVKEAFA